MTPTEGRNGDRPEREPEVDEERLAELARILDALAARQRAEIAEARDAADEADLARVERAFDAAAGAGDLARAERASDAAADADTAPPTTSRTSWIVPLLAAAAVLLVAFVLTRDDEPEGPGPGGGVLGGDAPRIVRPPAELASPDDLTVIQWDFPRAMPTWTYGVRIIDPTDRETLTQSGPLDTTTWLVPAKERSDAASWPDTVMLVVEAFSGDDPDEAVAAFERPLSFSSR